MRGFPLPTAALHSQPSVGFQLRNRAGDCPLRPPHFLCHFANRGKALAPLVITVVRQAQQYRVIDWIFRPEIPNIRHYPYTHSPSTLPLPPMHPRESTFLQLRFRPRMSACTSAAVSRFGRAALADRLRAASAFMHEGLLHTVRVSSAQLHGSPVFSLQGSSSVHPQCRQVPARITTGSRICLLLCGYRHRQRADEVFGFRAFRSARSVQFNEHLRTLALGIEVVSRNLQPSTAVAKENPVIDRSYRLNLETPGIDDFRFPSLNAQ
jgi:hypothetical protein